ncbi:thiamine phosphate synthase [Enterococcus sp. LJL99]
MKTKLDYRLYLITDRQLLSTTTLQKALQEALEGGVTFVQLREKKLNSKTFYQEALLAKKMTTEFQVPLIINDRIDIALACDADGVHVGQSDLPVKKVREIIGNNKILGASVQTVKEAIEAEKAGADYLGVGAMFPTTTKKDAILVSKEVLKQIVEVVSIPIIVIGGINAQTISEFKNYDIQGFAVISAILANKNIKTASENLLSLINQTITR